MGRDTEIKAERRRRKSDVLGGRNKRLSVDESKLDREKFEYRWINDTGSRVHDLTVNDDWDIVDKEKRLVGEGERGDALNAVLVRKKKDYYKNDEAAKQRLIDEQEKAITSGNTPDGDGEGQYVPQGGISVGA